MSFFPRLLLLLAVSQPLMPAARAADDFLPPHAAFRLSVRMADAKTIAATWEIADGYYMYREQFRFKATDAQLGTPALPPGKLKFDETFNKKVETYRHRVTIHIPVQAPAAFALTATGQGCSDKGLCYPPQDATFRLSPAGGGVSAARPVDAFGLPAMGSQPAR